MERKQLSRSYGGELDGTEKPVAVQGQDGILREANEIYGSTEKFATDVARGVRGEG